MKGSLQELESSLRGKRSGDLASEVSSYMISDKHLNKIISQCYKELEKAEKNCNLAVINKDSAMVSLIKEVQVVSLSVLESVLPFLSGSKARSQSSGWSLVSKLIQQKRASHGGDSDIAAIKQIEIELHLLTNYKSNKNILENLRLQTRELRISRDAWNCVQDFAENQRFLFSILN